MKSQIREAGVKCFFRSNTRWRKISRLLWAGFLAIVYTACQSEPQIPEGCRAADIGMGKQAHSLPLTRPNSTNASHWSLLESSPVPSPVPSSAPGVPRDVQIDPDMLKVLLFEGNTAVLESLNQVHQAKEAVNIARGNLLPSINLGMLIQAMASPASMAGSAEFLMPFLLPSKWFDYFQSKSLLEADKVALQLVKVNEYASTYSLYQTILSDDALANLMGEESKDLDQLADYVRRAYQLGLVSADDLNQANGRAGIAHVNWSKVQDLVHTEQAAMRHALGLDVDARISWVPSEVVPSEWEEKDLKEALAHASEQSLEATQIHHLRDAARHGTWSKIFGFLNSASVSANLGSGGGSGLGGIQWSGRMSIGFAYFPQVELSQLKEAELAIQERDIRLGITEVLEKILTSTLNAKQRLGMALDAQSSYEKVYQSFLQKYKLGLTDLTQVLLARSSLQQASVEVLGARIQVALNRISLHRSMLTGQFTTIEGCAAPGAKSLLK